MIFEMTVQIRVPDMEEGQKWYEELFQRKPDFVPHEGFAEWEVVPGSWLQLAKGTPAKGSGPLRLGVLNMEKEKNRVIHDLNVENFEIYSRKDVPARWGTFSDPWGNIIGFFEYKNKKEEKERMETILRVSENKL
ncbi:VOC family protein [Ornithinibacillus hominis]|uniref:VOC family protein n=1 Tax=Ornithinibacillus hominis TaxID=2763055 RepID=A0A923L997_9BACI|nr:VOC family protein [Ornithinibacillus hominis]MBC5638739.1 VOC family protein [Ornithinibacillus hominis]